MFDVVTCGLQMSSNWAVLIHFKARNLTFCMEVVTLGKSWSNVALRGDPRDLL